MLAPNMAPTTHGSIERGSNHCRPKVCTRCGLPASWEAARCAHVSTTFSWCRRELCQVNNLLRNATTGKLVENTAQKNGHAQHSCSNSLRPGKLFAICALGPGPRARPQKLDGCTGKPVPRRRLVAPGSRARKTRKRAATCRAKNTCLCRRNWTQPHMGQRPGQALASKRARSYAALWQCNIEAERATRSPRARIPRCQPSEATLAVMTVQMRHVDVVTAFWEKHQH